ncbi:MAG: hypothetical protein PVJ69_11530 [Desulfobacteraceae bacterium]|jgi:hypothetical protein
MIFVGTYRMPANKTEEWFKCFSDMSANALPSCIKKWQTFTCSDGEIGIKGYNIIYAEKGKGDEALMEISKLMFPFSEIEGASWKIEPVMGISDSLKILGKQ